MKIFLLLFFIISIFSCSKTEKDTQAPTIELLDININMATNYICNTLQENVLTIGKNEILKVKFNVADNGTVSFYKVLLYDVTDCATALQGNYLGIFEDAKDIVYVNQMQSIITREWLMKSNAINRDYLMKIIAVDANNNESLEEIKLYIKVIDKVLPNPSLPNDKDSWNNNPPIDSIKPSIMFSSFHDHFYLRGFEDTFAVEAHIMDNMGLLNAKITHYISKNGQIYGDESSSILLDTSSIYPINFAYPIDTSCIFQEMRFHIKVTDAAQNTLELVRPFTIY